MDGGTVTIGSASAGAPAATVTLSPNGVASLTGTSVAAMGAGENASVSASPDSVTTTFVDSGVSLTVSSTGTTITGPLNCNGGVCGGGVWGN